MATATTTKTTPKTAAVAEYSAQEFVRRRMDQASAEDSAQEAMMREIVNRHDGKFDRNSWDLSGGEWEVFRYMGHETRDDIHRVLMAHLKTMNLQAEVGDPATLPKAKKERDEAIEAENQTRADLTDLDTMDGEGPAIAQQIRTAQHQLSKLTAARIKAESRVKEVEASQKMLREQYPASRKQVIASELRAIEQTSDVYRRLQELPPLIHSKQILLESAQFGLTGRNDKDTILRGYSKVFLPEAERREGQSVDIDLLKEHVDFVRDTELPALLAEQTRLAAEWQETVNEVERPLRHWMQFGSLD